MASADYKASVIISAFLASVLGTANVSASPAEHDNHISSDTMRTTQCLSADQTLPSGLSPDAILKTLGNIGQALQDLYLHDFVYIEDYLHELPETPEADGKARAVYNYYEDLGKNAHLTMDQLTPDILKQFSHSLLGYIGVLTDAFGEDLATHERFTAISDDLSILKAYTADHLVLAGATPCPSETPPATGETLIGTAHPVLAF